MRGEAGRAGLQSRSRLPSRACLFALPLVGERAAAHELGVRTQFSENAAHDPGPVLRQYAQLAAEGLFTVPVARAFPLEDWRAAAELSLSGHPGGKLIIRLK
ncbi:zinc-binding dehydrogenase [Nocardia sp. NPDC046473]|uniref:zinc-binding dehydrogenase n=1 Tax=Nocardia sp. NPDC046473 TaxID=3155733 RepID=UPI0033C7AB03